MIVATALSTIRIELITAADNLHDVVRLAMKLVSTISAVLVLASATFTFAAQSYIVVDNQTGMILTSPAAKR